MSGTWIRLYTPRFKPGPLHRCEPPMRMDGVYKTREEPDGEHGFLWRCECRKLWMITEYPLGFDKTYHSFPRWQRADLLTRIQNRRVGR